MPLHALSKIALECLLPSFNPLISDIPRACRITIVRPNLRVVDPSLEPSEAAARQSCPAVVVVVGAISRQTVGQIGLLDVILGVETTVRFLGSVDAVLGGSISPAGIGDRSGKWDVGAALVDRRE